MTNTIDVLKPNYAFVTQNEFITAYQLAKILARQNTHDTVPNPAFKKAVCCIFNLLKENVLPCEKKQLTLTNRKRPYAKKNLYIGSSSRECFCPLSLSFSEKVKVLENVPIKVELLIKIHDQIGLNLPKEFLFALQKIDTNSKIISDKKTAKESGKSFLGESSRTKSSSGITAKEICINRYQILKKRFPNLCYDRMIKKIKESEDYHLIKKKNGKPYKDSTIKKWLQEFNKSIPYEEKRKCTSHI